MTKHGKPYEAPYKPDGGKPIRLKRRTVYRMSGDPTPEQTAAIDRVEEIVHKGKTFVDPYRVMRNAEYLGIELSEEYLADGKWYPIPMGDGKDDDATLTLMQKGAL